MRENALGPVSIRRYITPILILLSVMDGSIFLSNEEYAVPSYHYFHPCYRTNSALKQSFFEGKELTLKYFVYFCCIVLKQIKNSIL